jgi:hypothetical protein
MHVLFTVVWLAFFMFGSTLVVIYLELFVAGMDVRWTRPAVGRRFFGLLALGVPAAFATAGLMLALYFIFIDPCAGRHLLSLLRQRK